MRTTCFTASLLLVLCATALGCAAEPGRPEDAGIDAAHDAPAQDAFAPDAFVGVDAASSDAGTDATDVGLDGGLDAATCPVTLLVGGTDVAAQGWTTQMAAPATLTYGADYVRLETTSGSTTSGQLLLVRSGALPTPPFRLEVVMQVESVSTHNALDSAAAIMSSFTPPFGTSAERAEMIYLDSAALGWADDTGSFASALTDGAYHTYVLSVDATSFARVTVDGTEALTRTGLTTNGTIALGDQTNEPGLDGALRVRSVTLLCP